MGYFLFSIIRFKFSIHARTRYCILPAKKYNTYRNKDSLMGRLFWDYFLYENFCMSISAECLQELYMKWQAGVDVCLFSNSIENLSTQISLIRCNNWGEKLISHRISKWLRMWAQEYDVSNFSSQDFLNLRLFNIILDCKWWSL